MPRGSPALVRQWLGGKAWQRYGESMMKSKDTIYSTITGRTIDLKSLNTAERKFLGPVLSKYRKHPEWSKFASWWLGEFDKTGLPDSSSMYRICQDLEDRLGIKQGKVERPDYRDTLADLIEELYGSRYRFCKKLNIDQGHLSRVLHGRTEPSMDLLLRILEALRADLVIQPREALLEATSPEEAEQRLAGVGA